MLQSIAEILPLLIPVLALLIGLVVVGSIFIVHPLVKAVTRLVEVQDSRLNRGSDPELHAIEQRLVRLEGALEQVLDEREFDRKLQAGAER